MNKGALIKEIKRFNQDIDRKARNVEALIKKGPNFALQSTGAKSELEAICGSYFALIGEYTRKGMIVDMSITQTRQLIKPDHPLTDESLLTIHNGTLH